MKMSSKEFNNHLTTLLARNVRSCCRRKKMRCVISAMNSYGRFQSTQAWKRANKKPELELTEFKRAISDLMLEKVDRMDMHKKREIAKQILFGRMASGGSVGTTGLL